VSDDGLPDLEGELNQYRHLQIPLQGCLVDAKVNGAYGGTGHRAPWTLLRSGWNPDWPPLILAGGLTPDVVSDAVNVVAPYGVDVASGVEAAPGTQDSRLVKQFIMNARRSEHQVENT